MLLPLLVSFFVTVIAIYFLRRFKVGSYNAYSNDAPQRFHIGEVSRLGGVAIYAGWMIGLLSAAFLPRLGYYLGVIITYENFEALISGPLLIVLIGAIEDITQKLSVQLRLFLTLVVATYMVTYLQISFESFDIRVIDELWKKIPFLGVALAIIIICGLPHAFNLIDGYNGLASSVAIITALALAHVSIQVGDREIASICMLIVGATLGFFIWNFPHGLIFAGDGGAYFWGASIGTCALILLSRHHQISPWFIALLLIYPVWEVIFSMLRKFTRGVSPGTADALHLHQLVYRRIVGKILERDESKRILKQNNKTTPYLIFMLLTSTMPSVLFWNNTPVLILCILLFIAKYLYWYKSLIKFKLPKWIKFIK